MDIKKTLTVEVNQKGVLTTTNALGKLVKNAQDVKAPVESAKAALEGFSGIKLSPVTEELKHAAEQIRMFKTGAKGIGEELSGIKNVGSFTSVATSAERLAASASGLAAFNAQLKETKNTLVDMKGLSLSGIRIGTSGTSGTGRASQVDENEKYIKSQQRLMATLEREAIYSERGKVGFLEHQAAMKGLTKEAGPYIERIKAASVQTGKYTMSQKELSAAMRMVPAQFTDIATQLAGGQNPFLIMLQQGGQMRDMFHGFGPMFKNVGGMIGRFLMNPFVLLAAAIGTVATGFYFGAKEAENFNKAVILTGNTAGISKDKFMDLSAEVGKVAGGQSAAAEALTAVASAGLVAGSNIERITAATANFARASGKDVEKVAQEYASLSGAPAAALLKLDDSYHFLTESTYEQVKALEKEGRSLEATKVAQEALAQAHENMTGKLVQNLGWVERMGNGVVDMYRKLKNAVLDVGRDVSAKEQIENDKKELAGLQSKAEWAKKYNSVISGEDQARMSSLKAHIALTETLNGRNEASIRMQTVRQEQEDKAKKAAQALDTLTERGLTKQEQKQKALLKLEQDRSKIKAVNPMSDFLSDANYARQKKAIEDQFKEGGSKGIKAEDNRLATLKAQQQALEKDIASLSQFNGEYSKTSETEKELIKTRLLLASNNVPEKERASLTKYIPLLEQNVALEKEKASLVATNKEIDRWNDIASKAESANEALKARIQYLKETGAISDKRTDAERKLAEAQKESGVMSERYSRLESSSADVAKRAAAARAAASLEMEVSRDKEEKQTLALNKLKADTAKMTLEGANAVETQAEGYQKELEWLALSNREREKAKALWDIEIDARKKIADLEAERIKFQGNEGAQEELTQQQELIRGIADQQKAQLESYNKRRESGLSFVGDMQVAYQNWFDSVETRQATMQSAFTTSINAMQESFSTFCTTGKFNVKSLFKTVLEQMLMVQTKAATSGMANWLSSLFGGSGDFASTAGNSSAAGAASAGYGYGAGTINAKGNAFGMNGVMAFANGGAFTNSIVNRPTLFPFAKGTGLMGEAGPEAIMPLQRDSSGKLGVKASGGGSIQNNVSVAVNVSGDTATSQVSSEQGGKQLGEAISKAVQAELVKQSRSGGLLDKNKAR